MGLMDQLAGQMGASTGEASNALAGLLPQLIDPLTPNGRVSEGGVLEQKPASLASKFLR
jgi:uncharacterized protein YidB (DUF937 family)